MTDCIHGQPDWAACPKCIDDSFDNMAERNSLLAAEVARLTVDLAEAKDLLEMAFTQSDVRLCNGWSDRFKALRKMQTRADTEQKPTTAFEQALAEAESKMSVVKEAGERWKTSTGRTHGGEG